MRKVILQGIRKILASLLHCFPDALVVKNLPANAGDTGSIPGSGRFPGGGKGNPLQYSCLGNPIDRGAWRATVHGVAQSQTHLSTPTWWSPGCYRVQPCSMFSLQNSGIDFGDISSRMALRKKLKCKTFDWYLKNVYPLLKPVRSVVAYGRVRFMKLHCRF